MSSSSTKLEEFLPFHRPSIGDAEIAEVVDTLKSGWLTMGPKTARFEELFADKVGARHAVAVSSCTAALHLALDGLGLGPGDEVVTSPYTFPSTVAAIVYTGATPILADTLPEYPNMDPTSVERVLSERTKVILPIHFAGAPCDMDVLASLAEGCGAVLVEDAAHAVAASYKGRPVGSIGFATAFSLYAGKNMTTGEGGMLTTDDDDLAATVRTRRLHGISRDAWKRYTAEGSWYYEVQSLGFKYNMTDINAAIGIHQLARLDEFQARRAELVALYDQALDGVAGCIRPVPPKPGDSAWHLYIVGLDGREGQPARNDVIEMLKADNIGTSVHFIPAHHHPEFQRRYGWDTDTCPNATRLYERSISLPLFPSMNDSDVISVADSLRRILGEGAG